MPTSNKTEFENRFSQNIYLQINDGCLENRSNKEITLDRIDSIRKIGFIAISKRK